MVGNQFLVDTDILLEHLNHKENTNSFLEDAMVSGDCFTTVLNASEIYFAVQNSDEKFAVDVLMKSLKVLGIHARYSLSVNEYSGKIVSVRDSLICVMSKINKLPVLTSDKKRYENSGIEIVDPEDLRRKQI